MSKIALDVESVLADTNSVALERSDALLRDELINGWSFSPEQKQIYSGVTDSIWRYEPQIIPAEEPNLDTLTADLSNGNQVDIVTGRQHVDEHVQWWLDEHDITYNEFISTGRPKYEFTEYDVFIDDNPRMFGQCRLLLRDQPWNEHLDTRKSKSVDRVYTLAEASEFL